MKIPRITKLFIKKNRFITDKKDKFIHGIGLESVKSSISKYDGELNVEDLENKFLVKIYIPLKENMTVGAIK